MYANEKVYGYFDLPPGQHPAQGFGDPNGLPASPNASAGSRKQQGIKGDVVQQGNKNTTGPTINQQTGDNGTNIVAGQLTIGWIGRVVSKPKRDSLVEQLTQSEKTSVAIVAFEPITGEMSRLVGELQSIFADGEWGKVPAYKADISNSHIANYYGEGKMVRNDPDGLHCTGDGPLFGSLVQWLASAGLDCKISPQNLYPVPAGSTAVVTIYVGRDLGP